MAGNGRLGCLQHEGEKKWQIDFACQSVKSNHRLKVQKFNRQDFGLLGCLLIYLSLRLDLRRRRRNLKVCMCVRCNILSLSCCWTINQNFAQGKMMMPNAARPGPLHNVVGCQRRESTQDSSLRKRERQDMASGHFTSLPLKRLQDVLGGGGRKRREREIRKFDIKLMWKLHCEP